MTFKNFAQNSTRRVKVYDENKKSKWPKTKQQKQQSYRQIMIDDSRESLPSVIRNDKAVIEDSRDSFTSGKKNDFTKTPIDILSYSKDQNFVQPFAADD